ncbi:endonuclease/exonuclease/phosphatase family metal-dependent hydrolase [Nonomuraea thailandensis]|uniref:Endonuclease/exonuclease/phosphatase family metal-dependent hydrolase n=1 Tax=Nonomuraea thailandensis TaxID=1188745 RepID=A0A9X2K7E6_9ACTN|nr:endonuclease/exonuclease/phosphatase family protein [Nonomuraea thailandensis]MCP2359711.1 endonuclease/exonuclease/phosphatase family metal-dependent hydrolase [Nonomuraea thailandensis]
MAAATMIRVGTYNLKEGGLDDDGRDDSRLRRQVEMLAGLDLHALALQELKNFHMNGWRRLWQIEQALGMRAWAVSSAHHGCHLAWLVRDPIRVIEERHDQAGTWWHALCGLLVEVAGTEAVLGNVHFAPSSPDERRGEAEACSLLSQRGRPTILCGDMNAFSITDTLPPSCNSQPLKVRKKLDRSPAVELEEAGLRDMGALLGDIVPTVSRPLPYRCDRIHTNLPREALISHHVVQEDEPLSDHRPVVGEMEIVMP